MPSFKEALLSGSFLLHVRKKVDYLIGVAARRIVYRKGPVDDHKIFVMTFDNAYTCNPKYIVEELLRREAPVQIVWAVPKAKAKKFPAGVKVVTLRSYAMFQEMASSKIWIDNALNCVWDGMPKKKEQIYINTWHGSMGIKRLSGNKVWMFRARRCNKVTNYCISNSIFEENVYRETFWSNAEYLRYGHPRNDILFARRKEEFREKVTEYFELSPEVKILLYAPTFRDDGNMDWLNINYKAVKEAMEQRFGGEWVILARMHFKNRSRKTALCGEDWLKNASGYPDMQELLAAVDAGITDYSSWAYDYVLTRNPLFIYAVDIEKYNGTRGFYYPLETTPFPIATYNEQLVQNILDFDDSVYQKKVTEFLEEKGCAEDGHASERVVDKILELIEERGSKKSRN